MSSAFHDPTSLGNLARIFTECSEAHLAAALERQGLNPDMPLGACLVAIGALTPAAVRWLVSKQMTLRAAPSAKDVARLLDYTVARLSEETAKVSDFVRELRKP